MKTNKPTRPSVKLVDGHATTTSTALAQFFGKRHDHVLRDIARLIAEAPPEFNAPNFGAGEYADTNNQKRPMYTITRDGFVLLAMGFTGKAALAWKIKYIEAFNKLEQRATARAVTLATRKFAAEQAAERRKALPPPPKALPAPDESLEQLATRRLRAGKFVLYFGADGFMTLHSVSRDAITAEPGEIAAILSDPKSGIGREHLPGIIQAAVQRLS